MFKHRPAAERGRTRIDWLDSWHSFSFADYHDPKHMAFGPLRVINEDFVAPGAGFPLHGHADMEIITVVLSGALSHRDSLGNGSTITPGEVQLMRAGSGIRHSEFNASPSEPVHLLQIWILPQQRGLPPAYAQRPFPRPARRGRWQTVVAADGADDALAIAQDARLALTELDAGERREDALDPQRRYWLQVASGRLRVNGQMLQAGDGLAVQGEAAWSIEAIDASQLLRFDLPG